MKPLKIVIISFTMYPELNARSFRATELAKELACKGHNVILYAVLGNYDYSEFTAETGVCVKNLNISKKESNNITIGVKSLTLTRKFFWYFFEYPFIKLIPMVAKVIRKEENIDYLITIAFPHHLHWGASFSRLSNIKCWTADCGDPYMKNPGLKPPFYFKWMEKRWCKKADYITIPTEIAKSGYYRKYHNKIHVIPQGFNFSDVIISDYKKNDVPTFAFAGNCLKKIREVSDFLEYLCSLKENFKFVIYTKTRAFFEPYIERLGNKMELNSYIPRNLLLKRLSEMDFLINIKNISEVQIPSKLIDYYFAKRPILEISSSFIEKHYFNEFLHYDFTHKLKEQDMSQYDISNVADNFLNLYHSKINA